MATPLKRATVYLDAEIHKALKLKSAETDVSASEFINEAVRIALLEDAEDLADFEKRKKEPSMSYELFLKRLKKNGKI